MSTSRFRSFIPFVFKWECVHDRRGNVIAEHDPDDPGGLTKYGIDKRSHPGVDITGLTLELATEIYWKEWVNCGAEGLPEKLGEAFFNACVNCGVSRAQKIKFDPEHPKTASGFIDGQDAFYHRLVDQRVESRKAHARDAAWLRDHPDLSKFLRGWLNRTADLRKFLNTD